MKAARRGQKHACERAVRIVERSDLIFIPEYLTRMMTLYIYTADLRKDPRIMLHDYLLCAYAENIQVL